MDWYGPIPSQWGSLPDDGIITVPETVVPVATAVQNLQMLVNPMAASSNYGIDLFEEAVTHASFT